MKKILAFTMLSLFALSSFAQFGAGVNVGHSIPRYIYDEYEGGGYVRTGGLDLEAGIGLEAVGNYTFNNRIQCESSFAHLRSVFFDENTHALILSMGGKYKFFNKSFRPYVGAGFSGVYYRHVGMVGYYTVNEGVVEEGVREETDEIIGLVFEPALGAYWDSGIIDNVCFNLQARTSFDLTTGFNGLGYYRFSLGLNYFFNKKEETQSRSY